MAPRPRTVKFSLILLPETRFLGLFQTSDVFTVYTYLYVRTLYGGRNFGPIFTNFNINFSFVFQQYNFVTLNNTQNVKNNFGNLSNLNSGFWSPKGLSFGKNFKFFSERAESNMLQILKHIQILSPITIF